MSTAIAKRHAWFPTGNYSLAGDQALAELADSTALHAEFRLFLLCMSRMNVWGHASFKPNEVCDTLGINRSTFTRAKSSLKSAKMIAPESTARCLVVSAHIARRGGNGTKPCFEYNHDGRQSLMWIAGYGWERNPGEWHGVVTSANPAEAMRQKIERTITITEKIETEAAKFDPWAMNDE
jgi:hypothetical protein